MIRVRVRVRPLVLSLLVAFPASAQQQASGLPLGIAQLDDSVVLLTDGRRYEPGLYGIKHVYTLRATNGTPYFVFLGVGCTQCDGVFELYVLRPGEAIDWLRPLHGFAYPGRNVPVGSDSANAFRRQFFGHCLPNAPASAVQFAHEHPHDHDWVDSIRTLVPTPDSLIAANYPYTDYLARRVLALVRSGACREWRGR
jgi:hypothetical protein